jgi:hypothetical protein
MTTKHRQTIPVTAKQRKAIYDADRRRRASLLDPRKHGPSAHDFPRFIMGMSTMDYIKDFQDGMRRVTGRWRAPIAELTFTVADRPAPMLHGPEVIVELEVQP